MQCKSWLDCARGGAGVCISVCACAYVRARVCVYDVYARVTCETSKIKYRSERYFAL